MTRSGPQNPGAGGVERALSPRVFANWIIAAGATLSGLAFILGGVATGAGALVGSLVALANWLGLAWLLQRLMAARKSAGLFLILLLLKMAVLGAVCYFLVAVSRVDLLGFLIGLSSLVLGLLLGAALHGPAQSGAPEEAPAGDQKSTNESSSHDLLV